MNVLQLTRAILAALAEPGTFAGGIFMSQGGSNGAQEVLRPARKDFLRHFDVVFVEPRGHLNLAASVSSSSLALVSIMLLALCSAI